MSPEDASIVMKDLYDVHFGICDHFGKDKSPLSSVLHHEPEETWYTSKLSELIEEFAVYNLGELYNLSLTEYLLLPRPYVALLRKLKEPILKKKEKLVAAVEQTVSGIKEK